LIFKDYSLLYKNYNSYHLFFLTLFLTLCNLFSQNRKPYFDCPCPQIIAHQGSSLELPPNTVEAFQLALKQGADIIELDIWRTEDGEWVVVHDENLLKITGINKNVGELTLSEINSLDAGYGFYKNNYGDVTLRNKKYQIPTLERIFKIFPNEKINIEIKDPDLSGLSSFIDLINKYKAIDNILVVSSHYGVIKKFRRMTEYQIATAASRNDIKNMMFWNWWPFYKFRFDAFQLPFYSKTVEKYGMNNVKWVKDKQEKQLEVHYWTIDNTTDIKNVISIGANGIITNRPGVVYDILKAQGRR
jgi:glycerophosphoryl diester phosphodiesterase